MEALVLAGGLGSRLRARLGDLPKSLAPVAGRPFLTYALDLLHAAECRRVVLATGYLSEAIESHFGSAYRGIPIQYSREQDPLGTGGAIVNALDQFNDGPFLVMNGDTWFGFDIRACVSWCEDQGDLDAMVVRRVPDSSRYGAVALKDGWVDAFGEKRSSEPGFVNAGAYYLRRRTFSAFELPTAFSIERDLFQPHARQMRLRGYVAAGDFIDIGVPEDYDRAQIDLPRWLSAM
jgi:D-glycero-alpha-D-manno-heptose 1-phosphate guanylyltransferase